MYCFIARFIIFFLLIYILARKCTSWVQPQIGIYPGFLDLYSANRNFVNSGDLITGQPYTLSIRMDNTDRYDYLIQSCTYNNKYHFIDENSCLACDKFFLQMWENDMYRLESALKRTFIHFMPPEPLARLECSVRILHCCGCAERACERKILSVLVTYPHQVVNLAVINEQEVGILATSAASWRWWIWFLILLGLILLLCLLPLFLLLCSQLRMRRRKISDSKAAVPPLNSAKVSNILVRAKEMETNGTSEDNLRRPSVLPPPPPSTRIFRTSSDSSCEIAHSTASQSRIAVVIRQQQPRTSWAESTMRDEMESRPTLGPQMERVTEEFGEVTGLGSKFQSSPDKQHIAQFDPERAVHQQTACEEKFFKKSGRQNETLEEGYDRAQLTYTTPKRHFFHSEVV
uniref:ZP domain-containing protein n=2 Tax=Wuchereria bancrofti TaxID=6293 RepID=A0A1I8E8J7_WUCBA